MIPADEIMEVTEEHLKSCVDKEAEIKLEMYVLGQIEKDIENVTKPLHGDSLKGRVRSLTVLYGKCLREMGYTNFISKRGHIRKGINHALLRSRMKNIVEMHKKEGIKEDFRMFVRRMTDEPEAIDRLESEKMLETSDSDSDEQAGHSHSRQRKQKGKRRKDSSKTGSSSGNSKRSVSKKQKTVPNCLNPHSAGKHFMDKCPKTSIEKRKRLLTE